MSSPVRTHTKTFNEIRFADPYKRCCRCNGWVDGYLDKPDGPRIITPCEHRSDYRDVCPSWGPVDGCTCAAFNARHPDAPIVHDRRVPNPGDTRRY